MSRRSVAALVGLVVLTGGASVWLAARDGRETATPVDASALRIDAPAPRLAADAPNIVAPRLRIVAKVVPPPPPPKPKPGPKPPVPPPEPTTTILADVLFEFGKSELTSEGQDALAAMKQAVRRPKVRCVQVVGHTDALGPTLYNLWLSRARAVVVRRELRRLLRATAPRLIASGSGEAEPVVPNTHRDGSDNPAGRQLNRRVVFVIGC